jgi:4-alpha-glucanotransferase
MNRRGCGTLLHITSLPSRFGIGDLGPEAHRFIDLLGGGGQRYWQILPLNPAYPVYGNSPYQSTSAFACNPLLISPEGMVDAGLLDQSEIEDSPDFPEDRVDFEAVVSYKNDLFNKAFERFRQKGANFHFQQYASENAWWLDDYALFVALKERYSGAVWSDWPQEIRDRQPGPLGDLRNELQERVEREKFLQYIFAVQWSNLKRHCRERRIQIIGDIPMYLDYDSADLWANPGLFKLDEEKKPTVAAGVPPDAFSDNGQLWGNPIYNWDALREQGYWWWERRIEYTLSLVDRLRLDHFRGFIQYWEVPAGEENARNGRWVDAPGWDLFTLLTRTLPCLPIIAEDLGFITPDVHEVMHHFGFPGMKILLFAFSGDISRNPNAPHNITSCDVAYTGTHDNNTVRGWFETDATDDQKNLLFRYVGRQITADEANRLFIRLVMLSPADIVIIPMQDILGLGEDARMNRPGTNTGNWEWRLLPKQDIEQALGEVLEIAGISRRA